MTDGNYWSEIHLPEDLKKIYLNNFHIENRAKMVPFAGYSMPINYELGIINEHNQVRNFSGIFDVSHMGQVLIPDNQHNLKSLIKLIPINFKKLINNKLYYSFFLNNKGGIIDDLLISKINYKDNEYFFIVYNAGRKEEDEKILNKDFKNIIYLNNNSLISIQGPNSQDVIKFLNINNNLLFMQNQVMKYKNTDIIVNRSGYTGEDGFEISIPNLVVLDFINQIMINSNSKLCGLGSRDSLRLEAGLSLYGNELNEELTPYDANLQWTIHKERLLDIELNGQKNLLHIHKNGTDKLKIGLISSSKSILRSNMHLLNSKKKQIGHITSGGYSPVLKTSIAIGYINSSHLKTEKILSLIRNNYEELKIVKLPFISHKYRRAK